MGRAERNSYFVAVAAIVIFLIGRAAWHHIDQVSAGRMNAEVSTDSRDTSARTRDFKPDSDTPPAAASNDAASRNSTDIKASTTVTIKLRAVSVSKSTGHPEADKQIVYAVLDEIRKNPAFDPDPRQTKVSENPTATEEPGTFTWSVVARLNRPIKTY